MSLRPRRGRHPADPTGKLYGETHQPLPNQYDREPPMNIVINRETMTFIARGEYRTIWDLAIQQVDPEAIVIGETERNRTYSCFTDCELKLLYRNTTGFQHEGQDYSAMLQICKALGKQVPVTPTPEGLIRLNKATVPVPKSPVNAPLLPPTEKSWGGRAKGTRPKAGSSTGRVWDLADSILDSMPNLAVKELRAEIIRRSTEEGINPATAQVQYGKWKASKNL